MFHKIVLTLFSLSLVGFSVYSYALPDVVEDFRTTPLTLDRREPFFVYLSYGDPSSSAAIENVSLRLTLDSPALSFSTNNMYEVVRTNTQSSSCSERTEGEARIIRPELVDGQTLHYGPASATNPDAPSGEKTANINAKQTGCLKIGLKVTPKSEAKNSIQLRFEQVQIKNNEAKQIASLPVKIIYFALNAGPKSCTPSEEYLGGKCLPVCASGEYRALDTTCKPKTIQCTQGQEVFKDACVDVCPPGSTRNTFGECKKVEQTWNDTFSRVVMGVLGLTVFLVVTMLVANILKRLKRIK